MGSASTNWFNAGSSPTVQTKCDATLTRSGATVTVDWTVTMKLPSPQSYLGTGTLDIACSCSGGGSQSKTIKAQSDRWSGTGEHSVSGSYSFTNTSGSVETFTIYFSSSSNYFSSSGIFSTSVQTSVESYITAPTINSLSVASRTINTITFNFTCSKADNWYYKLSTASGYTTGSTTGVTSGSFTISGLEPNTSYTINFIARNWADGNARDNSANITGTTYNIATFTSVPNVKIGETQTITWENPSGAETSIKLYQNDYETEIEDFGIITGGTLSYTATANDVYALTPNNNEYNARYVITTVQNGQTYTSNGDFKFIVDEAINKPIFNDFEYEDINTDSTIGTTRLTGDNSVLIANYSIVKAIIATANKAQAQNYSNMTQNGAGYRFSIGNQSPISANWSEDSTVNLSSLLATDNVLNVSARDSRGFLTTISKTLEKGVKFIEYEDLAIPTVTATRNAGGAGEEVTLTINGTFWNHTFGTNANAVTNHIKSITYEYKETSSNTWITGQTTITPTESNAHYSYSHTIRGDLGADGFSISKSFNIRVTVKDELSTKTATLTLGSGTPAIAITPDNKVAIGQKYDPSLGGALQVNGIIYQSGSTIVDLIYPIGSIYMSVNSTNPSVLFGGTWVAWGSGRVPVGVDTNDTDFDTVEKIGGSKTHNHNLENGYAKIIDDSSGTMYLKSVSNKNWASSGRFALGGNTIYQSNNQTFATELGGSTDDGSSLQPYITCYMWKRTA